MKRIIVLILIIILSVLSVTSCRRQPVESDQLGESLEIIEPEFPVKAIQIVVPFAAGGGTDSVARAFAQTAKKYIEEPIKVVNKLGQGGARGITEGLFSEKDGYTVTLITTEINTLSTYNLINFDYTYMDPLILLNSETGVVVVSKNFPFDSIEELIAYASENQKSLSIGSAGEGTIWNIAALGITEKSGLQFEHKYYDGTSLAVLDVLGNKLDIVIAGISEVKSHIDQNQVKILTVLSDERIKELPDIKTFKESGYDFSIYTWRGMAVPKGVDDATKKILIEKFTKVAKDNEFKEILTQLNLHYAYKGTEEFEKSIKADYLFFQDFKKTSQK